MRFARVLTLFLGLCGPAFAETGQISVTGQGRVDVVPDMATITLGVTHQAENGRDAVAEVAVVSGAILSTLGKMGVEPRDMRTSNLSLSPVWSRNTSSGQAPKITGFTATNRVTVNLRDLGLLGDVLGRVTTDGANAFQGLQFGLQDSKPALDAARRLAVADAVARAELYAQAAGVTLGSILHLTEAGAAVPQPMMMARQAMASDMAMPIAQGEVGLTATVTMTFEIAE